MLLLLLLLCCLLLYNPVAGSHSFEIEPAAGSPPFENFVRVCLPFSYIIPSDINHFRGFKIFADWLNRERGGISINGTRYGLKLHLRNLDDRNITSVYEKFVSEDKCVALIGPFASSRTLPAAYAADAGKTVLITTSAGWGFLYKNFSYTVSLQSVFDDWNIAPVDQVTSADGGRPKTCLFVVQNDTSYREIKAPVERHVIDHGHQIVGELAIDKIEELDGVMETAKHRNPDVLLVSASSYSFTDVVAALDRTGWRPRAALFLAPFSTIPGFIDKNIIEGWVAQTFFWPFEGIGDFGMPGVFLGTTSEFVRRYSAAYSTIPTVEAAYGAAAGLTLLFAWTAGQSFDSDSVLYHVVNSVNNRDTFYGSLGWDENRVLLLDSMSIQFVDGTARWLDQTNSSRRLKYPMQEPIYEDDHFTLLILLVYIVNSLNPILTFVVIGWMIRKREHLPFSAATLLYSVLFLAGGLAANAGVYLLAATASVDAICSLGYYLISVGLTVIMLSLAVKQVHVLILLLSHGRNRMSSSIQYIVIGSVLFLYAALIVVWAVLDPVTSHISTHGLDFLHYERVCWTGPIGRWMLGAAAIIPLVLLIIACGSALMLCWLRLPYSEPVYLGLAAWNVIFVLIVCVPLAILVSTDAIKLAICLLATSLMVTSITGWLYLPKIRRLHKKLKLKRQPPSSRESARTSRRTDTAA
jgi:ABC-type branched-subunit amino acid transport system substrate-binding protein